MTVNASIQARLSDEGACWFEVQTLTTHEALYRQFLINMGKLMADFKKQSQASKGDKVVSFGFNVLREAEQTVSMKGDA